MPITIPAANPAFVNKFNLITVELEHQSTSGKYFTYVASTQVGISRFYKSQTVKSDGVIPTTYGRVSVYGYAGNPLPYYYGVGQYGGYGPKTYLPNYILNSSNALITYSGSTARLRYSLNNINRVKTDALAGFMSDDISMSSTIAEAGETASWVADKFIAFAKTMKAIKTGNLRQLRRYVKNTIKPDTIPRTVSGRFLEYKYAVRPLVMEIEGGMSILENGLRDDVVKDKPWLIQSQSFFSDTDTVSGVHAANIKSNQTCKRVYRCALFAEVVDPQLHALAMSGLTNISGGIWELVPFSFVVDWGLPIGNFLAALSATQGLKFHHGFVSVRGECVGFESVTLTTSKGKNTYTGEVRTLAFERLKLTDFPTPLPYIKSPFSLGNALSATAILHLLTSNRSKA